MGTGLRVVYHIDFKGYREPDREAGLTVNSLNEIKLNVFHHFKMYKMHRLWSMEMVSGQQMADLFRLAIQSQSQSNQKFIKQQRNSEISDPMNGNAITMMYMNAAIRCH